MMNELTREKSHHVFISGATGFLGGWLVSSLLEKGYAVTTLLNSHNTLRHNGLSQYHLRSLGKKCTEVRIDLTDLQIVSELVERIKPTVIIHLAAVGDVTICAQNPPLAFDASAITTLNLLEALRNHSPETLFLSHTTDKVYSGNPIPFTESMPLRPSHIYEVSKVAQEHLTKCYAEQYGLKTITIRCGNYFGGYDFNFNRIIPYTIKQCLENKTIELRSNGRFTRDFLYIEDAVLVNLLLIERYMNDQFDNFGEAFNFSLEVNISVLELIKTICKLMRRDPDIKINDTAKAEIPNMLLSCEKSRKILGWSPKFTLEQGLQKTIDAYSGFLKEKLVGETANP